ncbi:MULTISPECIES: hypothetical protein [Pseudomonas]|uniref:hypothetical protein n=1 Tax=Pseudomonas TaxID=286 RepID=UPI00132A71A7|nr:MULTISPECIES: hypothetical protein [Pseudomonas]MCF3193489.1 hypothetical protein [Pseudomonas bubulae]MQT58177.1 hypothetical protein [Pseudomonas sp. FSL R10-0399]
MSHNLDIPITHVYRGHTIFLKFDWARPNNLAPESAKVIQAGAINGMGEIAAELVGPWADYHSAVEEAIAAAERWIDSQLSEAD